MGIDMFSLPSGYGFSRLQLDQLRARDSLVGTLQIWEPPRTRGPRRYVLGVDVSDGIGEDRSVVAVHRMGTVEESEEQVALYVTDDVTPQGLAFIVDAIAGLYVDEDNYEALMAIECNSHGLSCQDLLQLHLGRSHFYRWEYLDAADAKSRFSTKIGWVTTARTRPLILDKVYHALITLDPVTHLPDLVVHSSLLVDELRDFATDTTLAEAAATRGAHDDIVMATAIAHYICFRLQGGEQEPLSERRHRLHQEKAARDHAALSAGQARRDWRNTACTAEEQAAGVEEEDLAVVDERSAPIFLP